MFYSNVLFYRNEAVGELSIQEHGLYYVIEGDFYLPKESFWRVIAVSETKELDLGLCVKFEDCFVFKKRIAKKMFSDKVWRFFLKGPDDSGEILENRRFDDLDRIEQARLSVIDKGLFRIVYSDQ